MDSFSYSKADLNSLVGKSFYYWHDYGNITVVAAEYQVWHRFSDDDEDYIDRIWYTKPDGSKDWMFANSFIMEFNDQIKKILY